jgi:hypothetical protein
MNGPLNLRAIHAIHTRFILEHDKAVADEAEKAAQFAEAHVHLYPGFKPGTGALQDATEHKIIRTARGRLIRMVNAKKYAPAIDLGARAHVIRPRRARFLRFTVGGKVVFARKVNHPGNRPYRFLYRATNAAGRVFFIAMQHRMGIVARQHFR